MNKPEFDYKFLTEYLEIVKRFGIIDKYPKNRDCRKLNFVEEIVFNN